MHGGSSGTFWQLWTIGWQMVTLAAIWWVVEHNFPKRLAFLQWLAIAAAYVQFALFVYDGYLSLRFIHAADVVSRLRVWETLSYGGVPTVLLLRVLLRNSRWGGRRPRADGPPHPEHAAKPAGNA
jgi:hypothetical protein